MTEQTVLIPIEKIVDNPYQHLEERLIMILREFIHSEVGHEEV